MQGDIDHRLEWGLTDDRHAGKSATSAWRMTLSRFTCSIIQARISCQRRLSIALSVYIDSTIMIQTTRILSAAAAAILLFPNPSLSQNDTSKAEDCPIYLQPIINGDYNSSGTLAFQFEDQDEWRLSLTLQDIRRPENSYPTTENYLATFLSVPESLIGSEQGNKTAVCTYWMNGRNATVNESNNSTESCGGILSDRCREVLQAVRGPSDDDCPSLNSTEVREACGDIVWLSTGQSLLSHWAL